MPRACVLVRNVTNQGVAFGQVVSWITAEGKICHLLPKPLPEVFIPGCCAKSVAVGRIYACVIVPNDAGKRQKFRVEQVLDEICPVADFPNCVGKQVVKKELANAC